MPKEDLIEVENEDDEEMEITLDDKNQKVEEEEIIEPEVQVEKAEAAPAPADKSSEEIEEYSQSVQKRINKLTRKLREAERREQEAVGFAQSALKKAEAASDSAWSIHADGLKKEKEAVVSELARANKLGDAAKQTELQTKLAEISAKELVAQDRARRAEEKAKEEPAPQAQPQQPQAQPPSPRAQKWAEDNDWFGEDEAATYAALAIHRKLVIDEGFDPTSEEYYDELDNRIMERMPTLKGTGTKRERTPAKQDAPPVEAPARQAAASSTRKKGRRTVRLTRTQVAMARRLGLTPEQYAAYVPSEEE